MMPKDGSKYTLEGEEDYMAGKDVCPKCLSLRNSRELIKELDEEIERLKKVNNILRALESNLRNEHSSNLDKLIEAEDILRHARSIVPSYVTGDIRAENLLRKLQDYFKEKK